MYHKQRYAEKVQMKKTIKMHEERNTKAKSEDNVPEGAVPAYLLDRETQTRAKVLSNMIKQKRKEKAVCGVLPRVPHFSKTVIVILAFLPNFLVL